MIAPKPRPTPFLRRKVGIRPMTYIAAFRCREGFVCCADTEENDGDFKHYVEKLSAFGNGDDLYPFIIGGAGTGIVVDALSQEISESLLKEKPIDQKSLMACIKRAVKVVYAEDVPHMALGKAASYVELLVALNINPSDSDFQLIWVRGSRVYSVPEGRLIVGYSTTANKSLLDRMHKPDISMGEAVVLAALLVNQSKYLDAHVGGAIQIGTVSQFQALIEDPKYVEILENRAKEFQPISDLMFLSCTGVGCSKRVFEEKLNQITELARIQRRVFIDQASQYMLALFKANGLAVNWPYAKFPIGGLFSFRKDEQTGEYVAVGTDDPEGDGIDFMPSTPQTSGGQQ
jgi:predicted proteasome-type protease